VGIKLTQIILYIYYLFHLIPLLGGIFQLLTFLFYFAEISKLVGKDILILFFKINLRWTTLEVGGAARSLFWPHGLFPPWHF